MGPFRELRMKKIAPRGIKDQKVYARYDIKDEKWLAPYGHKDEKDTRQLEYGFWSSPVEVPRQLEATRWMDFDFRVARVSF